MVRVWTKKSTIRAFASKSATCRAFPFPPGSIYSGRGSGRLRRCRRSALRLRRLAGLLRDEGHGMRRPRAGTADTPRRECINKKELIFLRWGWPGGGNPSFPFFPPRGAGEGEKIQAYGDGSRSSHGSVASLLCFFIILEMENVCLATTPPPPPAPSEGSK